MTRKFVSATLRLTYGNDATVATDTLTQQWCNEMISDMGAKAKKLPTDRDIQPAG